MEVNKVCSYIYFKLSNSKQINPRDYEQTAIKIQKVLYITELMHRILFRKPLITDSEYTCLKFGPAVNKKYLDYGAIINNIYTELEDDEISILDTCLKEWVLNLEVEKLIAITHKENDEIPLNAWYQISRVERKNYGTVNISEDLLNKDAEILKNFLLKKITPLDLEKII